MLNTRAELIEEIQATIDKVIDPCSIASGAPVGLVEMGLVRNIDIIEDGDSDGANVSIDMCVTEPGCMMASVFELTVRRDVAEIPGVSSVKVAVDHGYLWEPSMMAPTYRERLKQVRTAAEAKRRASAPVDLGLPRRVPESVGRR